MSTIKSVKCNYEVSVGSKVLVYKNVEKDFLFCKIVDELPTYAEHLKHKSGPSYSYNNVTTYYVDCGIVTRATEKTCWVKPLSDM